MALANHQERHEKSPLPELSLLPGEAVGSGLVRIIQGRLAEAVTLLEDVPGPAAVHEARKRFKLVRALLPLIENSNPTGVAAAEESLRAWGRQLAAMRDAEAMVETFDRLRESSGRMWGPRRFQTIRARLLTRAALTTRLLRGEETAWLRTSIRSLKRQTGGWTNIPDSFSSIETGLADTYSRARKGRRRAIALSSPEAFHDWRKRVRELRHQCQLLENLRPELMQAREHSLHHLGRILGEHHDLSLLSELLGSEEAHLASRRVAKSLQTFVQLRLRDLERAAKLSSESLFEEKPRFWTEVVGIYWAAWRTRAGSTRRSDPRQATRKSGARLLASSF
jgi:CHAD domain-containing protein